MPCSILIDSCSYFRLADSLHPLLKTPFCEDGHSLGVIKDLQEKYKKNSALKHKFFWVDQKEYAENRKRYFQPIGSILKTNRNHIKRIISDSLVSRSLKSLFLQKFGNSEFLYDVIANGHVK